MNRQTSLKAPVGAEGTYQVKICSLCGTLNYHSNSECFTCGWHGEFSRDSKMIQFAWNCLETRFEEVRLEHVTSSRTRPLGDFGFTQTAAPLQTLRNNAFAWWQRILSFRQIRCARREAGLRAQIARRSDQVKH